MFHTLLYISFLASPVVCCCLLSSEWQQEREFKMIVRGKEWIISYRITLQSKYVGGTCENPRVSYVLWYPPYWYNWADIWTNISRFLFQCPQLTDLLSLRRMYFSFIQDLFTCLFLFCLFTRFWCPSCIYANRVF